MVLSPLTWGQVSYATSSPALSRGGMWRTTPAPAAFPMWGYVRQVSYATSSPAAVTRGQVAYDTCSTCQCFLFWARPGPSREGSCVRRMTHVGWATSMTIRRCPSDLRDSGDITSPTPITVGVSGSAPTAFRRTAATDARLVGRGVAPGQSPSQLTPLGGTYHKTRVLSRESSSGELVKLLFV